ncbi:MAG: acyltransferase [Alphaproteobacteria bacterium]|nr:acyltransferase [Alphaproteobacteria bacterium]
MKIKKLLFVFIKKLKKVLNSNGTEKKANLAEVISDETGITTDVKNNLIDTPNNSRFIKKQVINFWKESSNNTVKIGINFRFKDLRIDFKGNNNTLIIGDNVRWNGYILVVGNNRTVKIGNKTRAINVYILSRNEDIIIGNKCLLSREIEIRTSDAHKIYCLESGQRLNDDKPVIIADRVWVAAKVIISKGSSVPRGCVIGAGSFVNKEFTEENVIIAGVPAKVVRRNIFWRRT